MTNMRERIRRVLEEECYVGPYTSNRAVDKVLEALLEPTEEMVDAMNKHAGSIAPEYAFLDAIRAALAGQ